MMNKPSAKERASYVTGIVDKANSSPEILSILYDMDLMPEQIKDGDYVNLRRMVGVTLLVDECNRLKGCLESTRDAVNELCWDFSGVLGSNKSDCPPFLKLNSLLDSLKKQTERTEQ